MKITKHHIGKKVQPECWQHDERVKDYIKCTAVGRYYFLGVSSGSEYCYCRSGHMEKADWKIWTAPKKAKKK